VAGHAAALTDAGRLAVDAWLQARIPRGMRRALQPDNNRHTGQAGPAGQGTAGQGTAVSPHTQRAYRLEAERFLRWLAVQRGVPLRGVGGDDCAAYLAFLADPQPRAAWCAPRAASQASAAWRPMAGPLSEAARRRAADVLRLFFAHLVHQGQLPHNPWSGLATPPPAAAPLDAARHLPAPAWQALLQHLRQVPSTPASRRLQLGLLLLHGTGLRLGDLLDARLADLRRSRAGWQLSVAARGRTPARVLPLQPAWIDLLRGHLADRGLDPRLPAVDSPAAPLLGPLVARPEEASADRPNGAGPRSVGAVLSASTFYRQARQLFADCALQRRAQGDRATADLLDRASPHWLRHSHALEALADGVPHRQVARQLGHASPTSMAAYRRQVAAVPPRRG
jgi:integrase